MCGSTNGIIDLFISHPERLLTKDGTRQKFQKLSNAITIAIDIYPTGQQHEASHLLCPRPFSFQNFTAEDPPAYRKPQEGHGTQKPVQLAIVHTLEKQRMDVANLFGNNLF